MKNLFIVFEGLDGSGKTTIAKMLSCELNALYIQTPLGYYNQVRKLIDTRADITEHFLFYLAAVRYASEEIKKLLKQQSVICDRYSYSTIAYHRALGLTLDIDINQMNLLVPDYVFFLEISDKTQLERLANKKNSKTQADDWIIKQGVFQKLNQEFKKLPLQIINAENQPEQIVETIKEIIQKGELQC